MNVTGSLPSRALWGAALAISFLFGTVQHATAQEGPSLRSVDRPVQVALNPVYQYYETSSGQELTELSTKLSASVPIGQRFTVQARAGYARMGGGDNLAQVRGLTDAEGRVTYARPTGDGSIVFSATVSAPTGKQKLSGEELTTTRIISRNFYDFEVTSFSRGLSISPQVTWAFPVNDRFAVGVGAGYKHQRGFRPRADLNSDYVPGDGIGGNAGFDYQVTETSALGVDVSFRRYAADKVNGNPRFDAGTRISGTARYLVRSGFTTIRVLGRYANWEKSEFGYQFGDAERGQIIPSHAMLLGSYKTRLTEIIDLRVRASGHHYAETIQADRKILGRVYASPSFELTDQIALAPHGTASYGSYLGLAGGLRILGQF